MLLTVVGCSGSLPGPWSPSSSYLVTHEGSAGAFHLLLDAGLGSSGALRRYIEPSALGAMCLTHLHMDHCADMWGYFVTAEYLGGGGEPIPFYAPPGACARLSEMLGVEESALRKHYVFHEWEAGVACELGELTVTPYAAAHSIDAYCLRIQDRQGRVLTYSGDTDDCDGFREAARGADVLLAEASFTDGQSYSQGVHFTTSTLGRAATECEVKHLVVTHIPPGNDVDATARQVRSTYPGACSVAAPGLKVCV